MSYTLPKHIWRVVVYPRPSIADPAHIIWWTVDGVGSEGTRFQRTLIRLLRWSIKRSKFFVFDVTNERQGTECTSDPPPSPTS